MLIRNEWGLMQHQLQNYISTLSIRDQNVLLFRVFYPKGKTLETLGNEFHVERETIRLIEVKIKSEITKKDEKTGKFRFLLISKAEDSLFEHWNSSVTSLQKARSILPGSLRVAGEDVSLVRVVSALANSIDLDNRFVYQPSKAAVGNKVKDLFESLTAQSGFFIWESGFDLGLELGVELEPAELHSYLTELGFDFNLPYVLAPRLRTLGDKAHAMLMSLGPQKAQEIMKIVAPANNARSFLQRLVDDERIKRVSEDIFAAGSGQEWKFKTIAQVIEEELLANSGSMKIEYLVPRVKAKKDAAESSIRAYCARPPFVLRNGFVSFARQAPRMPRKKSSSVKGLFTIEAGFRYRLVINSENLRGSSVTLGVGIVNALSLEADEPKIFANEHFGQIRFWWDGGQPKLSSVKAICDDLGLEVGDLLFFDIRDTGTFEVSYFKFKQLGTRDCTAALFLGSPGECKSHIPLENFFQFEQFEKDQVIELVRKRGEDDLIQPLLDCTNFLRT